MDIEETFDSIGQGLYNGFRGLGKVIQKFINSCVDLPFLIACKKYPNRKIVHLALHGKNYRIRKKNKDKILRWYKEENKC